MEKIITDRKRESDAQEYEWQRLSFLQALICNVIQSKRQYKPTDFYIPSWQKDIKVIEDKEQQIEQAKNMLARFGKKLKK